MFEATWVNTRSGAERHGSEVRTGFRGSDRVRTGSLGSGPPPNPELDFRSGSAPVPNLGPDLGPVHSRFGSGPKFGTKLWHPYGRRVEERAVMFDARWLR